MLPIKYVRNMLISRGAGQDCLILCYFNFFLLICIYNIYMMKHILKFISLLCVFLLWIQSAYAVDVYPEIKKLRNYYTEQNLSHKEEMNAIIRKYEDDIDFNFQLGALLMELKRPLDAEVIFKKLYEKEPKDKYEIKYGEALLAQYKFEEILYKIKLSALSDTLKSEKYTLHAGAYFGLKKNKTALKFINQALLLEPNNSDIMPIKAQILTSLNQFDESLDLLNKIKQTDKNFLEIMILKADNYVHKKNYEKAKHIYDAIIIKNPNYYYAYIERANVHLLMNNPQDSIADGVTLFHKNPNDPMSNFIIARALNQQKKYAEALKLYDKRGDINNVYLPGLLLEAEINFNNQNYDRAKTLINKYLKYDSHTAKALKLKGILNLQDETPYDALGYLEDAYSLDPKDLETFVPLAHAYYDTGHYNEAENIYKKLAIQSPYFKSVSDNAFSLACKLKTVALEKPKLCTNNVESEIAETIFDTLKLTYIGYPKKALKKMEKLFVVYPNNSLVQTYYAYLLGDYDNIDKAVIIFFDILKQDPNNKEVLSHLYRIYKSGKSSISIIDKMLNLFKDTKNAINAEYYLANFFYQNYNYNKAISITKTMLERNPNNITLYEMIFKIMMLRPSYFTNEIQKYWTQYQKLNYNNPSFIRFLRKKIMQTRFKKVVLNSLNRPLGEKTAKDYQVYAEYLNFINDKAAASAIYGNSTKRFTNDFELYKSAFDFYNNKPEVLTFLKNKFSNKNQNYQLFFQAKLYVAQHKPQLAADLLSQKLSSDTHGLLADLLLTIQPNTENIDYIANNLNQIVDYKYEAAFTLAKIFYKQNRFDKACDVLVPFYNIENNDIDYKLLLAKAHFYTNFQIANEMMQSLIQEFPTDPDVLTENIAFEVKNKHYTQAISVFEKIKPSIKDNPNIYFYYAFALFMSKRNAEASQILKTLVDSHVDFFEKDKAVKLLRKLQV